MLVNVYSVDGAVVEQVACPSWILDLQNAKLRIDIIKRVVMWQMAKARSGCHKTKSNAEVSGTGKKPFKQKGTGRARQGSLRSVHMRGGGVSHGPVLREHATSLQKKVRRLGLIHAIFARFRVGAMLVVDQINFDTPKTSLASEVFQGLINVAKTQYTNTSSKEKSLRSVLVIDDMVEKNLLLSVNNLHNVNVLPAIGANVHDIVRHDVLVLTKSGMNSLTKRLVGNV